VPKKYWLFKSEPETFSFDHLVAARTTFWDGVRNFQARNLLRDEIRPGDRVLFYHSREEPMAIAGLATVVKAGAPDPSQFDPASKYHDEGASPEDPRWYGVEIRADERLDPPLTREELKASPALADMMLLKKGSRLSVQPVTAPEWEAVLALAKKRRKRLASD